MRSTNQLATASLFKVTKYFKTPIILILCMGSASLIM